MNDLIDDKPYEIAQRILAKPKPGLHEGETRVLLYLMAKEVVILTEREKNRVSRENFGKTMMTRDEDEKL